MTSAKRIIRLGNHRRRGVPQDGTVPLDDLGPCTFCIHPKDLPPKLEDHERNQYPIADFLDERRLLR
jgi:hypothetical protein